MTAALYNDCHDDKHVILAKINTRAQATVIMSNLFVEINLVHRSTTNKFNEKLLIIKIFIHKASKNSHRHGAGQLHSQGQKHAKPDELLHVPELTGEQTTSSVLYIIGSAHCYNM